MSVLPPIKSMNAEDDGTVIGYMCGTDWECEIGSACDGNRIFPSPDALKECLSCWKGCGIVEVKVAFSRVIEKGDGT